VPVLKKNDPFGLQGYGVAFSMDKRKRWAITDRLRNGIVNYQVRNLNLFLKFFIHFSRKNYTFFKNFNLYTFF
jgi:hypothetical protein